MVSHEKIRVKHGPTGPNGSFSKTLFYSVVVLVGIGLIGVWCLARVEQAMKTNLENQLKTSLSSTVKIIQEWARERFTSIEVAAANPEAQRRILSLADKARRNRKIGPEQLSQLPEQQWLREHLGLITKKYGFTGFVVFDNAGFQIAALLDEPLGRSDLIERSDFFQRALNGNTVLSVPFQSETPLPDVQGRWRAEWPTMFVATPVRDKNNRVAAVLSFRLRPEGNFSDLFKFLRPGLSGETYAFNNQGILISYSRFEPQLRTLGLIPNNPESSSILNLEIRDPGGNMTEGFVPEIPRDQQPLTHMAQRALKEESGISVDGYNDYRGVPVVGAWTWLKDFNFGITHEIDVAEAFTPLATLNRIFLILYGLLLGAAVLGLIQYHRKQKAELEKKHERREAEEISRRMESVFSKTIDGIIIMDDKGIIESFNPAAERIFGYSQKEVIGKNVKMLMPEPYQSEHDGYLDHYRQTGKQNVLGQLRELVGLRKDGSVFLIELAANVIPLDSGTKFTGIIRDINERKKIEYEMAQAKQEAEIASEAKTQFLSQMSHELRTPMNAILGFAQILHSDPENTDTAVQVDCLNHILSAGNHLMELINQILDLSRIETGQVTVKLESVELSPLIKETLALSKPLTASNQVTLIDRITDTSNHTVRADQVCLRQVLLNLISNAIKFNRNKGTATLACEIHDENRLRISVTDTGPGISEEDQKNLFQPFTRLQRDVNTIEGTGIGLTISQLLTELMGGVISVTSEVGNGCTFTIELPLATESLAEPGTAPPEPAQVPPSPSREKLEKSKSVLYIEDHPANMFLVKQILATHRPEVELLTTPQGEQGILLAKQHKPALILLDLNLPGINGLDVFLRLQQHKETKDIPVVVVSANAMNSDIQKARELSIEHYLTKPINVYDFLEVLNQYLDFTPPAATPEPPGPVKKIKSHNQKNS